jgi:ribosomal protein S18 acetylase RimI-like enzyme
MIDVEMVSSQQLLSSVYIRPVVEKDLRALEWDGEFIHFRQLYADTYRRFQHGDCLMWVADLTNIGVIGQLFISLNSNRPSLSDGYQRAYIFGFRVKNPYRNFGVGSYMMRFVETDLKNRGFQKVTLNVARDNPGALRLYKRLGYQIAGTEPGRWSYIDHRGFRQDVVEPAWRMEKLVSSIGIRREH